MTTYTILGACGVGLRAYRLQPVDSDADELLGDAIGPQFSGGYEPGDCRNKGLLGDLSRLRGRKRPARLEAQTPARPAPLRCG